MADTEWIDCMSSLEPNLLEVTTRFLIQEDSKASVIIQFRSCRSRSFLSKEEARYKQYR